MRLDVRETVNVIVRTFPGASSVLRRHGLDDLLWWAGTPLDEACRAQGIDVEGVAEEIVRQVDPDVAHAFKARPEGQAAVARPKAAAAPAAAASSSARAWEPPPSIVAMLAEPEAREDVMPDVAQVYRARPGHALPQDDDVAEVAPPPPPLPAVDEGMPDVAQVFKVRAGTPDAPFLHAHKPAPAPEPEPPTPEEVEEPATEEPDPQVVAGLIQQAVQAGIEWTNTSDSSRNQVIAACDVVEQDVEQLRVRRRELQAQLQELLALRDKALGQPVPSPTELEDLVEEEEPELTEISEDDEYASEIFDDDDPPHEEDEPVSEIFDDEDELARDEEPADEDELGSGDLSEVQPEEIDEELAESLEAPAPESQSWVNKVKSWFAA